MDRLADLRARGSNDWPAICPIESPCCLACQKCRVAWELTPESRNDTFGAHRLDRPSRSS